jgi:predicted tellurium resistance membrane protein TerC
MGEALARIVDVLPHYLVMLALVFLALEIVENQLGIDNVVVFFAVVLVIVFAYRPIVLRLGVAPESWNGRDGLS